MDFLAPPSRKASKTAQDHNSSNSAESGSDTAIGGDNSKRRATLDPLEFDSERGAAAMDSFPLDVRIL